MTLSGRCDSENDDCFSCLMGQVGLEPTRGNTPEDFKSSASASSATAPRLYFSCRCSYVKE